MSGDKRALFRQQLESGEARLHPISFPQRELWETSPVAVADPANHICGFVEIMGRITFKELEMAIQRVVDRQEAMRTSFLPGKERVLQMIRAKGRVLLGCRDLSSRLFGGRSSWALVDSGAPSRGRRPPRARISV